MPNGTSLMMMNDDRIIATKWTLQPGTETGAHTHALDYVVVYLTSGTLTVRSTVGEVEASVEKHQLTSRSAGVQHTS
jgi:beta-alanine degradation protein BauB